MSLQGVSSSPPRLRHPPLSPITLPSGHSTPISLDTVIVSGPLPRPSLSPQPGPSGIGTGMSPLGVSLPPRRLRHPPSSPIPGPSGIGPTLSPPSGSLSPPPLRHPPLSPIPGPSGIGPILSPPPLRHPPLSPIPGTSGLGLSSRAQRSGSSSSDSGQSQESHVCAEYLPGYNSYISEAVTPLTSLGSRTAGFTFVPRSLKHLFLLNNLQCDD
ncbi:uncharacterized protein LOC142765968 [Rhipicephalus microplus]|uniref:uncharacterized protein LOC142765968 n=1 Tax=Rhipicephalus microplus TaxID=6941 RepID=UPI003F6D8467